MSSNLPAALGGDPTREPGTYRTTPEVDQREVDYTSAQILTGDWEPDATKGGLPIRGGLELHPRVAEALGVEQAALAAEFADVHAHGQEVTAIPCNNGTHAIRVAMTAFTKIADRLGVKVPEPGDEVLVPALTWQATAGAILRRNLIPVLVDIDPDTLCLDPAAAEAAVTERTAGMIPVHLYGQMAEMDKLLPIASKHAFVVGEDCAHAHGAIYAGLAAGTLGHFGSTSWQGSKKISSQEGGMIVIGPEAYARNPAAYEEMADQVISMVTCGRRVGTSLKLQADNDRMQGVIAALGRAQLIRFPEQHRIGLATFAEVDRVIAGLPGMRAFPRQDRVDVPPGYKKLVRFILGEWGGMTLDQIARAYEAQLGCEFARIYHPLAGTPDPRYENGNPYYPNSDPALRISEDHWRRIDRGGYRAPNAWDAFETVLGIEHAAGLDGNFPEHFAEATRIIQANSRRLARELTA